jgi:hypothetical protein
VAEALARYAKLNAQVLISLESEIAFYLGALQWMKRVRDAGIPLCAPKILPGDDASSKHAACSTLTLPCG